MSTIVAEKAERRRSEVPRAYLRPSEAAATTGLSKSAVMQAIWAGRLEAFRMGRAWLIPADAVDRWIRGDDRAA